MSSRVHEAPCLRSVALELLALQDFSAKALRLQNLSPDALSLQTHTAFDEPRGLPGRPLRPELVSPRALARRSVGNAAGHASLIHALAHIEANAINLALDLVWRFAGQSALFYRQWFQVAREEALHFRLLSDHLQTLGLCYGDLPAHDGLWEMAERTRGDLLARLALVPRTLEARGLDVTPAIRGKLISIGDQAGAAILDIILRDEIGHVAVGNHWYRWHCAQRGLDPHRTYEALARQYRAPKPKGPFNLAARRQAGFDEVELGALGF